ncbi:hypothetical protein KEM52_003650 [Ascosphaera acerosa]|nr:hypothetical protein KEM52_003650 [Ascosphaera acerosa]
MEIFANKAGQGSMMLGPAPHQQPSLTAAAAAAPESWFDSGNGPAQLRLLTGRGVDQPPPPPVPETVDDEPQQHARPLPARPPDQAQTAWRSSRAKHALPSATLKRHGQQQARQRADSNASNASSASGNASDSSFQFVTVIPESEEQRRRNKALVRSHASRHTHSHRSGSHHAHQHARTASASSVGSATSKFSIVPAKKPKLKLQARSRTKVKSQSQLQLQSQARSPSRTVAVQRRRFKHKPEPDSGVYSSPATSTDTPGRTRFAGQGQVQGQGPHLNDPSGTSSPSLEHGIQQGYEVAVLPQPTDGAADHVEINDAWSTKPTIRLETSAHPQPTARVSYTTARQLLVAWRNELQQSNVHPRTRDRISPADGDAIPGYASGNGQPDDCYQGHDSSAAPPDAAIQRIRKASSLSDLRERELIHYAVTQQWPGFLPSPLEDQIHILQEWCRLAHTDALVYTACLCGAVVHQQVCKQLASPDASLTYQEKEEWHQAFADSIQQLKQASLGPTPFFRDEIIFALLWMCFSTAHDRERERERRRRSALASRFIAPFAALQWLNVLGASSITHGILRNLHNLIQGRGLSNIKVAGLTQLISTVDILVATRNYSRPVYPYVGLFPQSPPGQTPGWPTSLGTNNLYLAPQAWSNPLLACPLPQPLRRVLLHVQDYTAVLSKLSPLNGENDPNLSGLHPSAVADRRNYVQWQTTSLPDSYAFGDYCCAFERLAYGPLRIAALLYSMWVVFPLPPESRPFNRLAEELRVLLRQHDVPEAWTMSAAAAALPTPRATPPLSNSRATSCDAGACGVAGNQHPAQWGAAGARESFVPAKQLSRSSSALGASRSISPTASTTGRMGSRSTQTTTPPMSSSSSCLAEAVNAASPSQSTAPLYLLLWVIVMGGIAAEGDHRIVYPTGGAGAPFFVATLRRTCRLACITSYSELRTALKSVAWMDGVCDEAGEQLWCQTFEGL